MGTKGSFHNRSYCSEVTHGCDTLRVVKGRDSEWTHIVLDIHGEQEAEIVVRSKEHLEHLQFMLGQALREETT